MPWSTASRGGRLLIVLLSASLFLAVVAIIAAYVVWQHVQREANAPRDPGDAVYVIESGDTLGDFLALLQSRGVVDDPRPLRWWSRFEGNASQIKVGRYRFDSSQSFASMLDDLAKGKVSQSKFALIEGQTTTEMLAALRSAPDLDIRSDELSIEEIMTHVNKTGVHHEGQFFPDTYLYDDGSSDLDLLRRASERLDAVLAEVWEKRQDDLPLSTPDEALVLASIIEKETSVASERAMIAGVFVNRLRKGMRLQTDPTVIYGVGDGFDGNLTRKHLRTDTPYNTYTRAGLPPTPIAAVGRAALEAAVNPEETKALYFVAKGDGSHQFSETLEQHNAAVQRYQLKGNRS